MKQRIKKKMKPVLLSIKNYSARRRLKNRNFTIISDNCWGGQVYQDLGLEYNTPFVGLFVFSPDYIRLVKDLKYYLSQPLTFTKVSIYKDMDKETREYPIGLIGDIEIHFLHYKNEEEARKKWNKRLGRINWNNIFIKFNDRDCCTEELLKEFDELDYDRKIIFTANKHDNLKNYVWYKEYTNAEYVEPELKSYKSYFDVVSWLNQDA